MTRPCTTIELVRHGEAHPRDRWRATTDAQRPLNAVGQAQARGIADQLAGTRVDVLFSSPFVRCRQTLEPLAADLGLDVVDEEALAEVRPGPFSQDGDASVSAAWLGGRAARFLDRAVGAHEGGRIVACSHGDVIPAVLAVLVGRDGLPLTDVRVAKGGRCTLEFDGSHCVGLTLHPPPEREEP